MAELNASAAPARAFSIDEEFSHLLPERSAEEKDLLDASIAAHGVREPGVVWKEERILLDGHGRLAVCDARGIELPVVEYPFPDRHAARCWIVDNALARRNLTDEQRRFLRGQRLLAEKRQGARSDLATSHQSDAKFGKAAARIAKREGVSQATIERDAKFAADVDALAVTAGPETKRAILDGTAKATRRAVSKAAAAKPKSLAEFKRMVGADKVPPRTAPATRGERDHVDELNALAERTSAAMRAYCKAGARSKDRERLTELWELRSEIERLFSYLEGQK